VKGRAGLGFTILAANAFFQNILSQLDSIKTTGRFYLPRKRQYELNIK
jgi:hypothetical protein